MISRQSRAEPRCRYGKCHARNHDGCKENWERHKSRQVRNEADGAQEVSEEGDRRSNARPYFRDQ